MATAGSHATRNRTLKPEYHLHAEGTDTHQHISLAQRLQALRRAGQPTFKASTHPTLLAFAQLFIGSELVTFGVNKRLRDEALTPLCDCETESR